MRKIPDSQPSSPAINVTNQHVYLPLIDDNAALYEMVVHSSSEKNVDSQNESGSNDNDSPNTSLRSAWTDEAPAQHASALKTLYVSLSEEAQKYDQAAPAKFYRDMFKKLLRVNQQLELQFLLEKIDRKELLSDMDNETFIRLMEIIGLDVRDSRYYASFYEAPVQVGTAADNDYAEPEQHTVKPIPASDPVIIGIRLNEKNEEEGPYGFDSESVGGSDDSAGDSARGYLEVGDATYAIADNRTEKDNLYDGLPLKNEAALVEQIAYTDQAIYDSADDRTNRDEMYAQLPVASHAELKSKSAISADSALYAIATDHSNDPLYGSDAQALYAVADPSFYAPLNNSDSDNNNYALAEPSQEGIAQENNYALAAASSQDLLSDIGLKSESSVDSDASAQTVDVHSEHDYGLVDASQEGDGFAQQLYELAEPEQVAAASEKRPPELPPRQEKPAVPLRHSLANRNGIAMTDVNATQSLLMPDDRLSKDQQAFISAVVKLIKNTPIEKEVQKEVIVEIDKTQAQISVSHNNKHIIRRGWETVKENKGIAIPVAITVIGAVAFLGYWFSRGGAASHDASSTTTPSPEGALSDMCKSASHAALNLGFRLVDGLFSVNATQADSLCAAANVSVTDNKTCVSFLTNNCTQLFSAEASVSGTPSAQQDHGFVEAMSTAAQNVTQAATTTITTTATTALTPITHVITNATVNATTTIVSTAHSLATTMGGAALTTMVQATVDALTSAPAMTMPATTHIPAITTHAPITTHVQPTVPTTTSTASAAQTTSTTTTTTTSSSSVTAQATTTTTQPTTTTTTTTPAATQPTATTTSTPASTAAPTTTTTTPAPTMTTVAPTTTTTSTAQPSTQATTTTTTTSASTAAPTATTTTTTQPATTTTTTTAPTTTTTTQATTTTTSASTAAPTTTTTTTTQPATTTTTTTTPTTTTTQATTTTATTSASTAAPTTTTTTTQPATTTTTTTPTTTTTTQATTTTTTTSASTAAPTTTTTTSTQPTTTTTTTLFQPSTTTTTVKTTTCPPRVTCR